MDVDVKPVEPAIKVKEEPDLALTDVPETVQPPPVPENVTVKLELGEQPKMEEPTPIEPKVILSDPADTANKVHKKLNKSNKRKRNSKTNKNTKQKLQKKSKQIRAKTKDKLKRKSGAEDAKHNSDSEGHKSDDLDAFLAATEPKKPRRTRKRKLTKEEEEAREKENLRKRTCEICNIVFSIPKGLQNHVRVKHTFERPYSCEQCGETFSVQSSYALHRRRHLGIKPHLCNICGKNFLRLTDMRIHMQTHNKTNEIKCDLCPNVYNSNFSLKKHKLIIHTDPNEWKHSCQICGKKCVSTTTLNIHVKQHNEDRSFKCHICGKGFYTNQNRKVHIRTHSADTRFNCENCSNGYRSNEALQRHMVRVHGIGKEKPITSPKFFCLVCNEGFVQKARMERHVRLHETGEEEYPFECLSCHKRYKNNNFFSLHMKNKHDVEVGESFFRSHRRRDMYPTSSSQGSLSASDDEDSLL